MAKTRFDIHQHVTDTIIAQIEAGTPPWRKPWTGSTGGACLPVRHNGEAYKGINILMLWATAHMRGLTSERWMTFKQAQDLGGSVKKGAKAAKSVFYGTIEKEDDSKLAGEETTIRRFARFNNVFNADDIEGLPEEYYICPDPPRDLGTKSDARLDAFFAGTGAVIITSEDPRAYYSIEKDHIHMPPIATFHDAAGFFGTLAHESIHWSGSAKRLDRFAKFQDRKAYAFEELVAEIGACILGVTLGVAPQFDQSAAYIEGWIEALKNDKGMIFKAASEAQKAVDFIMASSAATAGHKEDRAA